MKKRALITISIGILLLSCSNRQPQTADKIELSLEEKNEAKKPPLEILEDTSFTDFFDNFMWNWDEKFQVSRVVFPFKKDNKTIQTAKDWKYLPFYTNNDDGYIPILSSDTLVEVVNTSKVELSILDFKRKITEKYYFEKINNKYFLVSSENTSINNAPDAEFIDFLTKFSTDSLFQINHILFPLLFSTLDYAGEFDKVTKKILLEDWKHTNYWIKSIEHLNKLMILSNINSDSKYRTIFFRGSGNGIWVVHTFEKINESWKLIKFEDYSM